MRILIADDNQNQLVRRGIARVLSDDRNCQVCGEASDAREQFSKLLQFGLIGYDQWQVSNKTGLLGNGLPASRAVLFSSGYRLPDEFHSAAEELEFLFQV